jgi:hypothetical protein
MWAASPLPNLSSEFQRGWEHAGIEKTGFDASWTVSRIAVSDAAFFTPVSRFGMLLQERGVDFPSHHLP